MTPAIKMIIVATQQLVRVETRFKNMYNVNVAIIAGKIIKSGCTPNSGVSKISLIYISNNRI